ncbi:flagellar biosynthesis protein FlhF [Paenibacillus sp. FA6]|uniref:flagellar biosynthesis protein FlhF n=1 Tax=Paenibacillus sp. FA6 TaxID=3413029 RepID=UPI003F65E59C
MRVKRYIVDHMPEAMQRIRVELGSDAVILSTKELKVGGFLGMFQKKKIEVIAAVEKDSQVKLSKKVSSNHSVAPTLNIPVRAVPEAYQRTNDILKSSMKANHVQQDADIDLPGKYLVEPEEKLDVVSDTNPSFPARHHEAELVQRKRDTEEHLLKEIREMKLWMAKISRQSMMKQELPPSLEKLQNRLLQQEVDEQLREEWMNAAFDYWEESGRSRSDVELEDFIRAKVTSFLSNRLGGGIGINTKIVYVAGPTGVGKTTTIAKLAAEQLFRHHRKVGFITADTYRISAVEQLRTYASILNVPLEVVQSPADLKRAMKQLDYCDLILMDTAGRNYRNELLVSELQSLLTHESDSETYLVLSLTSKAQDMKKITEHFSEYGLDKVIFTKLDETGSYGAIFNLIYDFPIHLSYLTNGQNVPEDLIMPNDQMLCNLLLDEGEEEL